MPEFREDFLITGNAVGKLRQMQGHLRSRTGGCDFAATHTPFDRLRAAHPHTILSANDDITADFATIGHRGEWRANTREHGHPRVRDRASARHGELDVDSDRELVQLGRGRRHLPSVGRLVDALLTPAQNHEAEPRPDCRSVHLLLRWAARRPVRVVSAEPSKHTKPGSRLTVCEVPPRCHRGRHLAWR